jgi:hypothetical protein
VEYGKAKRRRFPCFQLNSQRNGRFAKRSIGAFVEKTSSETRNGTVKMATTAKFLRPITQSLAAITSSCPPISHSRRFCNSLSLSLWIILTKFVYLINLLLLARSLCQIRTFKDVNKGP